MNKKEILIIRLNELSDREKIEVLRRYGATVIQHIKNPSLEVQLAAVKDFGFAIEHIENPSEEVKLEAVKQDGLAIKFINNPSEELKLEAVRENGYAIQYINNPSLEMQLEAVKQDGFSIQHIYNPSEEVQLEAVRQNGLAIKYIDNPSIYIKYIVNIIETSHRTIYVLHEPNKDPLFSIGCQKNISKKHFIWRIYNTDGGLENNPHRQEYLDILERY